MEEKKDKNINFLSDSSKKKKIKSSKKIEKDEYEPAMVRPDSEKLKRVKKTNVSGSDISFFKKISNWFDVKFSFTKTKKDEKPRIQELQELIGKSQHVGEVMINDDEVLPDEERDSVVEKETIKQSPKEEEIGTVKIKDDVVFVTKEDHVAELLRGRDKINKTKDKNTVKAQDISLQSSQNIDIPKSEEDVYSMPQSLEDVSLAEPMEEEKVKIENLSLEDESSIIEDSKVTFWDKIKTFFSGMFTHKAKEVQSDKKDDDESVLSYELRKFAQEESKDKKEEYIVSTSTKDFAAGLNIMEQDTDKTEEEKEDRASLEKRVPDLMQNEVLKGQGKEELLKAQEELFSELPEQSPDLEDIFASVGNESENLDIKEEESIIEDSRVTFWDKIKTFFSGMFAHKAKEVQLDKKEEGDKFESDVKSASTEIEKPEEVVGTIVEPEVVLENIPELESASTEIEKPEEVVETIVEPEVVSENIPEPEKVVEPIIPIAEEDTGVQESLPKSLTEPSLNDPIGVDLPSEQENTEGNKNFPKEGSKLSFFARLEAFFRKLFGQKEVKLDEEQKEEIEIAQYDDNEQLENNTADKKSVVIHEIVDKSPAAIAGMRIDDIVLSINGQSFDSADDFYKLIQKDNKQEIKLIVKREEENIEFNLLASTTEGSDVPILGFSMLNVNPDGNSYKIQDKSASNKIIEEDELSTRFHQPPVSTVTRIIDEEGGVDLIPIAIRTKSWMQIAQLLIAATIGSIVIVLSFYATLYFQEINLQKEKDLQESQVSELEQKIIDYKGVNKEIDELGVEIETVYGLFSQHIYWTNLFSLIEKYTLDDVYFSGFSSAAGGSLSFSATGKSYDTAARQLKLLQSEEAKEFVTSASINSVNNNGNFVTFSIILILNEELFYYSE